MLGYDSYIDSQIPYVGLIPSHWKVVQNKRVMHKEKRICSSYSGEDILSLTMNGVVIRNLDAGGKMPTTFDGYQFLYPGELLMCLFDIDVTPRCVGRVNNMGLTSPAYSSFVLHKNADVGYFYYYYLMLDHTKELLHLAKNLRHSLTEEQLGQIYVPLPPMMEQRTIASYLDKKVERIDFLISEAKASIEEYKSWKASIIYEAVTKGLDPDVEMKDSGVEWIGKIPVGWDIVTAKFLVNINHGSDPKTEGNIPVYGSGANSFKTCGEYKEGPVVLIGRKGATLHIPHYIEGRFWNVDTAFDVTARDDTLNLKLYYYLAICFDYKYYMSQTTLPSMTQSNYNSMKLPVPKKDEQTRIVAHLDNVTQNIDAVISEKETLIADLEAYKKSLIFEVVTGKRKVV